MTAEASETRTRFDDWAASYERDPVSRWLAGLQAQALEALDLKRDDRLLDVGCGTGAAVRIAAQTLERAAGVDLSSAMIERARELAGDLSHVSFHVGEGARLSFEDGEFTAILSTTAFHHFRDPASSVREMARVLASGGRLVIGDFLGERWGVRMADAVIRTFDREHVRIYRASELSGFLRDGGFADGQMKTLVRGAYAIVRARKP